jgi:hypothetical protein
MILYREISDNLRARRVLKAPHWSDDNLTEARMVEFTTSKSVVEHSQHNLEWLLTSAQGGQVDVLVITPNRVQMLGQSTSLAMTRAFPAAWQQEYREWNEISTDIFPRCEVLETGECSSLYLYRDCITEPKLAGVYEVATGRRMTNRREIIDRIWSWGFPTRRGRPLSVGQTRWSGTREELEAAEELYHRHYLRRDRSDVARKICQIYTSAVRDYAWPGNY